MMLDAVVVGAGPNGLAAALTLARAGVHVQVFEQDHLVGGGMRTDTWGDGYRSDWGSAVHPMALASPFFRELGIADRVEFIVPEASFAHPLERRTAIAWRSIERTAAGLGRDGAAWSRLVRGLAEHIDATTEAALSSPTAFPAHPVVAGRLAITAFNGFAGGGLRSPEGQALLAGVTAHTVGKQPSLGATAAAAVLLGLAHSIGWPIPVGGAQSIADALVAELRILGVPITTGTKVESMRALPPSRTVFFDTSARSLVQIAGDSVHPRYRRALERMRPGDAVSKVDFVTDSPIPWRDPDVALAGSVHLGGTRDEIRRSEEEVARGRHSARPMIVLSQPSMFDRTRVSEGLHSIWAYAHVPAGSTEPQTDVITDAIELAAPGFRDTIIDTRATSAAQIERRNPTMVGGDFASGAVTLRQILARPRLRAAPWLAGDGVYLCSTATFPGPGVHGMAGFGAARHAIRTVFASSRSNQ